MYSSPIQRRPHQAGRDHRRGHGGQYGHWPRSRLPRTGLQVRHLHAQRASPTLFSLVLASHPSTVLSVSEPQRRPRAKRRLTCCGCSAPRCTRSPVSRPCALPLDGPKTTYLVPSSGHFSTAHTGPSPQPSRSRTQRTTTTVRAFSLPVPRRPRLVPYPGMLAHRGKTPRRASRQCGLVRRPWRPLALFA